MEKRIGLEMSFQEEEARQALRSMYGDKAPRSDSFTIAFYQSCWADECFQ